MDKFTGAFNSFAGGDNNDNRQQQQQYSEGQDQRQGGFSGSNQQGGSNNGGGMGGFLGGLGLGGGNNQQGQNQAQGYGQAQGQGQGQSSGGFLGGLGDKFNSAAGGGRESEKNEDYLDKGVDFVQERFMGQGAQDNESAIEQAKDEQISDYIRGQYKSRTGTDMPIKDKETRFG